MMKPNHSIARHLEPFAESADALRGFAAGLDTAMSTSRASRDMIELQTRLTRIQGAARLRADLLEARAPQRAGDLPAQQGAGRARLAESEIVNISEASEGICLRVRAHVEENPAAVNPLEEEDARVVVFLDGDGVHAGRLLVETILGEYDPMKRPDALGRFVTLDFTDDADIVRFYQEFGSLGFPWRGRYPGIRDEWFTLNGEPVWWLKRMAEELRTMLQAYHAWQQQEISELRQLFAYVPRGVGVSDLRLIWLAGNQLLIHDPESFYFGDGSELPSGERRRPTKEESLALASWLVKSHLDFMLDSVRRVLGRHQPEGRGGRQSSEALRPFVPGWRFTCLLDALYLQVYDIVCSKGHVGVCKECRRPFPVPGPRRGTVPCYCGSRCRWRANKRMQRQLRSQSART